MELPIVLHRRDGGSLSVRIAEELRAAAVDGRLRVGDRLPSTRALAAQLGVSRTVTATAYEQLLAEGWLTGRVGDGTYVTAIPPTAPRPRRTPARRSGGGAPPRIDLRPGLPCLQVLDPAAWHRAWRTAGDAAPAGDPDPAGEPRFRSAVAEHLLRHRGLSVQADAVMATAGVTAALAEIAAQLPAGAVVAMEEPGYRRATETLRRAGLRVVGVPVDADGLSVDRLPSGTAAVYTTPAHQFPMATRMSAERRVALIERARRDDFLIVEDDYDGELRYDVAPLPLLAALGPDVVAHLGTTSKLITPTLGAGWLVAPPGLHRDLLTARQKTGIRPAPSGQLVTACFAESGDLARHLRRLRRELADRRSLVIEICDAAGVPVIGDPAGAHLRLPLPDAATERAVTTAATGAGVEVSALAGHHLDRPRTHGLSLGYAGPTRSDLQRAAETLTAAAARLRPPQFASRRSCSPGLLF